MDESSAVPVGERDEFEDSEGQIIDVAGTDVAVFLSEGELHAIENTCPHQGGPLGDGKVEGDNVYCPWHGFEFDLTTGEHAHMDDMCVETYPVFVEDETVYVAVE
ncbi:Rieske (2Fe-2S) protein [Halorussus caseinilyticus]|uniref:Rieske (2Fe-2S) protein n=1 Tax=Halorussus caseinilyticus TaxID=3034025 RepID=UPI0023E7F20C|nr:Rieske 2Fe-2S domain-containing protein [Halorussus sp. DT72]